MFKLHTPVKQGQNQGQCIFCQRILSLSGMARHLQHCDARADRNAKASLKNPTQESLYYIRVTDQYDKRYCLDLEIRGTTTLTSVDSYLREIWLECCGHLSEFNTDGWRGTKLAKSKNVASVFKSHPIITHLYDFGTTSETLLKVVAVRTGSSLTKNPIFLMARNILPIEKCLNCEADADYICEEYDDETLACSEMMLCAKHAKKYTRENKLALKSVNSPRLGMCGYCGPAEPPY